MTESDQPAGVAVDREVRPLVERLEDAAHAWENNQTICGDYMPSPAMLREAAAEIGLLRVLLEQSNRGEHICLKCGLRQDGYDAAAHAAAYPGF